ncbi:MAG: putative Zn-dependent protease [Paracoccaceae bacterium]|jgi:predicted Zn-dependent protease
MTPRTALAAALSAALLMVWTQPAAAVGLIRDAEIEATLHDLAAPIFVAAGLAPDAVDMIILSDSRPNAFVFGGRRMAFTTGLIQDMAGPGELQGVIAHETGHITGGHLARRAIAERNLRGPAAIAMLLSMAAAAAGGGGAGVAAGLGAQATVQRALLAYSRSEESAADQAALTFLEQARVDPEGMTTVLERFRGQEIFSAATRDPYVSTHPISAARLSLISRRSGESPYVGKPASPEAVYRFDRMRAKLDGFLNHPASTLRDIKGATDEMSLMRRAVALHRLPDPDGAIEAADALIAIRPDDAYYHELKGQFMLESGRGPASVAPYREAARLAPDEPLIRAQLGRALLTLGDPAADAEAVLALESGVAASDGGDPSVLRDLAFAYARSGREGMAALVTAERLALVGAAHDARIQAARAKALLQPGSPDWLRADDIVASLESID